MGGACGFQRSEKSEPGHTSPDILKYVLAEAKQNSVGHTKDSQAHRCVSGGGASLRREYKESDGG